jgi:hypothetical protein
MKQTAVEWLVEQIQLGKIEVIYSDKIHSIKCIPEIVQQAKLMEKEQIIKAVYDSMGTNFDPNMGRAEQYYKEKYGK